MCGDNCACRCGTLVLGFILFIGGSVGVIFFGFHITKPFLETINFTDATCTVAEVKDSGALTCDCGVRCQSVFPCKTLSVRIKTENRTADATLYYDGETWEKYKDKKCSRFLCRRDPKRNTEAVDDFLSEYGLIGKEYPCFVDPDNQGEAIKDKIGWISLGISMGIPTLCFIIGLILILLTCKGC